MSSSLRKLRAICLAVLHFPQVRGKHLTITVHRRGVKYLQFIVFMLEISLGPYTFTKGMTAIAAFKNTGKTCSSLSG